MTFLVMPDAAGVLDAGRSGRRHPPSCHIAKGNRVGMQPRRLAQLLRRLHVLVLDLDCRAGRLDGGVIAAEQDDPLTSYLNLRACHASPPRRRAAARENELGGIARLSCRQTPASN